jgi:hypothetical protein
MASDTTGLGVVNLDGSDRTQLVFLDIEEARRRVNNAYVNNELRLT